MSRISRPLIVALGIAVIVIGTISWWSFSPMLLPPEQPEFTVLLSGSLQEVDASHTGSGTVQLVQSDTGNQSILFIDVFITSGPDLYVYLSNKSSFSGIYDDPGEYVSLGLTPAVTGSFTVPIPENINGTDYASVLIWCQAYAVLFTYAVLE
ncbi:MAG: DM13 domain-containing protein [Candidatus Thorarchaeota archaeon]